MKSPVVQTIHLSYTAPDLPSPIVQRSNLISAIIQLFDSSTEIVCVEGPLGYGKTTLLREFAESCPELCVSVFLRTGSRHSYDPVLARADIVNQLYWYLKSRRISDHHEPSEIELHTLLHSCARKLIRSNSNGYFLIDGLHNIPDEDDALLQAIMGLLPFGRKPYRFLFSSDRSKNIFRYNRTLPVKSFVLTTFNSHESDEYLSDIIHDKSVRMEHHKALGGVPALLASTRRQILSQPDARKLNSLQIPPDIDAFLEAEWKLLAPLSEAAESVIGHALAYGRPISTEQLCQYTGLSAENVEGILTRLPFFSFATNRALWEFTSEPFRQYAEHKLHNKVKSITESIATRLLNNPDSDDSLTLLPQYLRRIDDTNKILEWFDERRLAKILLRTRTPAWAEPILRNAITLSYEGRNDRALTTYSILRSIIPQISNITGIEHEIRARCVLGDIDGARAVACAAPLLTQRLRLLAVLADAASERPGMAIQPLKSEIRELVQQIDLDSLQKEEAIDIAIDLYPVDQQLALRILKSAIKGDDNDDSMEIAMARITVAAIRSQQSLDATVRTDDATPKTSDVLVDEKIQKFINATQRLFGAKSAFEVLSYSSDIENSSERLFILRKWIGQHWTDQDVLTVVETAITEGISATDFAPTSTFYREVLSPLPHATDETLRSKLVSMVDAQKPVMKAKGPTVDYVRVQLLLAACNCVDREWERAAWRFEELYLDSIHDIDNLEILAACLAWSWAFLERFDPNRNLDDVSQFRDLIEGEFGKVVTQVLDDSADQYIILQGALKPLAEFLPHCALDLCNRLNTDDRRNQALLCFVRILTGPIERSVNFKIVFDAIDFLTLEPAIDKALSLVGEMIARHIEIRGGYREELSCWLSRIDRCTSATEKCESLGKVATALGKTNDDKELLDQISNRVINEFDRILNPRDRYTTGCKLIVLLHESCSETAKQIFRLFSNENQVYRLAENVEQGSFFVLDLLTKALCTLARADLLHDNDVDRIRCMISKIDDPYLRVRLFSRLAFFFFREEKQSHFSTIVNSNIWKELDQLKDKDKELLYRAWVSAYGVIWLENRDRARDALATFPKSVRNPAIQNLCFALLHKLPSGEPFDGRGKKKLPTLTYADIRNLLILCSELEEDSLIFAVFEDIADQIENPEFAVKFTRDQKAEIGRLMSEIADDRLPTPDGVQHLGYQIVCKAQAFRVCGGDKERWMELIRSGEKLDNLADRIYVLVSLASCLPKKMRKQRERQFRNAELASDTLRSIEDRYQRHIAIAYASMDTDRTLASRATENAFRTITVSQDMRNAVRERRLVDLAYSVDPELPMKLALLLDDDPARELYRERAKQQVKRQELKRELADFKQDIVLRERDNEPNLAVAAWQSLGALNAGRMVAVDMNRVRDMLACASNYPLETAYPMYSWVLSNIMEKYARTSQSAQYIRDVFEGVARGAGFFFMMTGSSGSFDFNPKWDQQDAEEVHAVIRSGERDKAKRFLSRWFKSNVEESVTVVDPYFGPGDLWVVKLLMEWNPDVDICIVTGRTDVEVTTTKYSRASDAYRSAWRDICDQNPPHTEILRVSLVESGKTPIHDRWIFSKSTGIRLGTSLNSFGNKLSEISAMDSKELERVQYDVGRYIKRSVREEGDERVEYELFELLL